MANQGFGLTGEIKVRPAEEADGAHLHTYCFPEKTKTEVTKALQNDLEAEDTHRLVAESGGYPIGQITVTKSAHDPETAHVANLAVAGPFRPLGIADHLMKAAETTAADNGVKTLEIELPASESNVIQRYKDWGFMEKPLVILQKALDGAEDAEDSGGDSSETTETAGEQQNLLDA